MGQGWCYSVIGVTAQTVHAGWRLNICQDLSRRVWQKMGPSNNGLPQLSPSSFKHGLLFVQQVGYCHADIKPANLMVDFQTQQMKLCNFQSAVPCGAMDLNSEVEGQSRPSYTESYRAPELWRQFTEYTGSRNDLHTSRTDLRLLMHSMANDPHPGLKSMIRVGSQTVCIIIP